MRGMSAWQLRQANACPCLGSDEFCPCQNVDRMAQADREVEEILTMPDDVILPSAEALLEWMTYHHLPLQLWREADDDGGNWVVCDNSRGTIIGSGGSALDALRAGHATSESKEGQSDG